ncbi:hypothetical protein MVEG_10709 [Podila verticillata NRRL 6337]|nr:hypothetical protein MVEG_10709 [Podila verticillata NRRL 6337]
MCCFIEWEGQRLPNECLLMVIEYLSKDLETLHTLLFVSKLFFKASAPLIYRNGWNLTDIGHQKITALLIASVIHSQRATAYQSRVQTRSSSASFASNFLAKYGLQLPPRMKSRLMQDAVQGVSPTTVDYSMYLAKEQSWEFIKYVGFVRLANAVHSRWEYNVRGLTEDEWDAYDSIKDGGLEKEHITFHCFGREFSRRLNAMFYQCSPHAMETLSIASYEHKALPVATKMPKLRSISLSLLPGFFEEWNHRIVSFVTANQVAFPKKKHLRIEFLNDRLMKRLDPQPGSPQSLEMREKIRDSEKSRIQIYKGVGSPEVMTATLCPGFYDMIEGIELDSLNEFTDHDSYRNLYGEGSQQALFFKQCANLKTLAISVRDPGSFSWAIERNPDGSTQRHRENYLRSLEDLDIDMDASLTVVDDAMTAFGESLKRIKIAGTVSTEGISPEAPLDPWLLRYARIGDWNLPSLRTMGVYLNSEYGVYIGNFDACPSLTTLSLKIELASRNTSHFTGPVYPSPIWKLPRLCSLELNGISSMLFDFDSLDHMPALEHLFMHLSLDREPIDEKFVPRLLAYRSHQQSSDNTEGAVLENLKWRDHWNLPRLKDIRLDGPSSRVFSFKWLESCPSLESLWLETREGFQRLPLSSSSKYASILPAEAPTQSDPRADLEAVANSGFDQGMEPLVKSKLRDITLVGPWVVSEHDLSKVLTMYAPNLSSLAVQRIHAVSGEEEQPWHGSQFLKIVIDAIGAGGRSKETKQNEFQPGRHLKNISSRYSIGEKEADNLGMTCAPYYNLYRIPQFYFKNCTLVRTADKTASSTH